MATGLDEVATLDATLRDLATEPEVVAAAAMGIDITLLVANLRRPPYERIRRHSEHARFRVEIQARTLPPHVRAALERTRLEQKVQALGFTLDQVLEPTAGDQH